MIYALSARGGGYAPLHRSRGDPHYAPECSSFHKKSNLVFIFALNYFLSIKFSVFVQFLVSEEGRKATRPRLTSDPQMTSQNVFSAYTYPYVVRPAPIGLRQSVLTIVKAIILSLKIFFFPFRPRQSGNWFYLKFEIFKI